MRLVVSLIRALSHFFRLTLRPYLVSSPHDPLPEKDSSMILEDWADRTTTGVITWIIWNEEIIFCK